MDSLSALSAYRDTNSFPELVRASAAQVREAFHAWECRNEKMEDHIDAATLDRQRNAGGWVEAAGTLQNMQLRRRNYSDCTFPPLPNEKESSLILNAARYLSSREQIQQHILSGRDKKADSLIESNVSFYQLNLKGRQGPPEYDPYALPQGMEMENYLIHRCALALEAGKHQEALSLMEILRKRAVPPSRIRSLQEELGERLAEKDLATTQLTNPKTILAKHIPMLDWYNALKKAYQKRFRKG
jgi:hypothetical protein